MTSSYVEFDVSTHFKSSLQLAISLATGSIANASPWRWIVIAIHDAIYSALVIKLTRTDLSGVYSDDLEKEFEDFYTLGLDSGSTEWKALVNKQDKSKLADLSVLIKRANLKSGTTIHKSVSSTTGPTRSLTLLKKRRDMFVHNGDYSLFSTEAELKGICIGSVDVLSEILALDGHRNHSVGGIEPRELVEQLRIALRS